MTNELKAASATLGIFISNDRPVVSSRDIARVFEKRHDNVIRDIENLECSKSFSLLNFEESIYETERGKEYPEYLITRDGFTFLAMGFNGAKAATSERSPKKTGRYYSAAKMSRNLSAIAIPVMLSSVIVRMS